MREYGYPRPSCRDCGKIDLSPENVFIVSLIHTYFHSIVTSNGMGGWSINTSAVRDILEDVSVDSFAVVLRRLDVALTKMLERPVKDEDQKDA